MSNTAYLDDDIVRIYDANSSKRVLLATLFWGDRVEIVEKNADHYLVRMDSLDWNASKKRYVWTKHVGMLARKARLRDDGLLKVRFVDVGQGDGAMIETPNGRFILVDGGEGDHLRRYVYRAFAHVFRRKPLHCEAIVVTHGDADHFAGLTKLAMASRPNGDSILTAGRIFHNGLVKRTFKRDIDAFGKTSTVNGNQYAIDLKNDLLAVADKEMNKPFVDWKQALNHLKKASGKMAFRRLEYGDRGAFSFLDDEDIRIEVLGPIVETVRGKPALPFLSGPGSSSPSASHTINGHSVVLKLTFGNVRILFGADLNEGSEERLLARSRVDSLSLTAEILKVPHHGSADFSPRMLEAVRPVVSVISSGDESVAKEYIHPRAGLVGALGKFSRGSVDKPLIYVTEMVAFFERLGQVQKLSKAGKPQGEIFHNGYNKKAFGIVHVRTDGERVLVATHSGKDNQKESYAFHVNERGEVSFEEKVRSV